MANPKVCPYLKFYPEDRQRGVSEARQAYCWLHEMADDEITPMAHIGCQYYYIHEPAMLQDGICSIPCSPMLENGSYFF